MDQVGVKSVVRITCSMKGERSKTENIYITDTKDFAGEIQLVDGKKVLKILSRTWYETQINQFRVGEKVSLYVSNRKPKRSEAQNRYYFGVYLPLVAKETGEHNLRKLHAYFKDQFLGIDVQVLGKTIRFQKSSTELSKNDFSEFIMNIEADSGVQAPPVENYGL